MKSNLVLSTEVADALLEKRPVVALKSTLITHGLPYPANVDTALAMEEAVRESGAVPATIAILKGQITVGLEKKEIERLGALPTGSVRKCSRRDLAIAVGLQEDAATTVAGTMIVAHMAGIRVFATGGIGGVHRGQPFDVSADLIELGRTPIAVVCSGAKSILDLPLTLEVLETQGVPIIGLGTDTLPAFYTRSSGLPIDACVESPRKAAQIIAAAHRLGMPHGLLITVPVPQDEELQGTQAEAAIEQATQEAAAQGVHGKAVTPFVLARVAELTDGESRRANVALLINNARFGGQIAEALVEIEIMTIASPRIVGIGSVFIDDIVLPSGQTYMVELGGGVVHALMGAAIWGERPGIVAPVGQGLPEAAHLRLQTHFDTRGLYLLEIPQMRAWQLFEEDGSRRELYRVQDIAPFTMGAQPEHLPDCFQQAQGYYLLQGFEGMRAWRDHLPGFVLWEPLQQVMIPGSRAQLRGVLQECRIDCISPNLLEAQAVYGDFLPDDLVSALFDDGARMVALRMGETGSLVATRETGEKHHLNAVQVPRVVDQTGAGNTYCGGLLWGLMAGKSLREAGAVGAVSASFCLEQVGVLDPAEIILAERDQRYQQCA